MREYHLPHFHRPDWYAFEKRFDHLIHAPWFWPMVILLSALALLIVLSILAGRGNPVKTIHDYPLRYPFML